MKFTRVSLITLAVAALATSAFAQGPSDPGARAAAKEVTRPHTIFVAPSADGFHVYMSAALAKKQVPLTIVTNVEGADLILTAATVNIQAKTATSKVVNCLFAYCLGNEDSGSTSVQLTRGEEVVWSYAVNKSRSQKNYQALAEAVAKHLKDDYLSKR